MNKPKAGKVAGGDLLIEQGGVTLKNHVVYTKNSDYFKLIASSLGLTQAEQDLITGFNIKCDLSPNLVVFTTQESVPRAFTTTSGITLQSSVSRQLLYGSFNIKTIGSNKKLVKYDENAVKYEVDGEETPNQGLDRPARTYVESRRMLPGDQTLAETRHYTEDYSTSATNTIIYGKPDDLSWFRSYEGGKYFGDGWWNNPFASNLT